MPDDGLSSETRAELSAIVADLEAGGMLLDAVGKPAIRWRDIKGLGLITPLDFTDDIITNDATALPDAWSTVTTPPSDLYTNLVEMWQGYVHAEAERAVPYGDPSTWTVVEASAGTLPAGIAAAVVSPTGPACWPGCKHTHMVLIQEPDQPQADEVKEPEVYRRIAAWWRRRWMVVLPNEQGTRRFWTRWRANRWARRAR